MHEHSDWDHCLQHASLTDVGLRRGNNQDALAVVLASSRERWQQRGHLFMVADGMGAHAAGELASKVATDVVPLTYYKLLDLSAPEALAAAVRDANSQINSRGQASEDFLGMGTTVSVLVLLPEGALTAHVGDSRVYRWRANRLEQLTFDHSLVWELRAVRQIPEEEVPSFIPKNVITRSLGPNPRVEVDLEGPFPIELGDTFLVCSDGLSGPLNDDEIGKILGCLAPDEAVRALVDLANLRGGPDNITVVLVRVTGPELVQDADAETARSKQTIAPRPVHPLVWTLLSVFALAALGLAVFGYLVPALFSLAAAAVTGIVARSQRYRGSVSTEQLDLRPLGKGPYTACECTADLEFVDRLVELTHQLRDAATSEDWQVDWARFDEHQQEAIAATKAEDYARAVSAHFRAIRVMMGELRNQRGRSRPNDGRVDDLP